MISLFKKKQALNKGAEAENAAADFLRNAGLIIVEQNFNTKLGEIDLVAKDGQMLVFVEVRYRKQSTFGTGVESVTVHKQKRIIKAAKIYLQKHFGPKEPACRFDVIGVHGRPFQFNWIENAFEELPWI